MKNAKWLLTLPLLSAPAICLAQNVVIANYPITGVEAFGITVGPDGALWFTGAAASTISRMTTTGDVSVYPTPTLRSYPEGIAAGPDGALWFTEFNVGQIGRITTAGAITEYLVGKLSTPAGIAAGPDGAMWFTENNANRIGRITTAGAITEYPLPNNCRFTPCIPESIAAGPDGALWFTVSSRGQAARIGRITTSGEISGYPVPTMASQPAGITAGPDGALWFTELAGNRIGRITTAGVVTEYSVPTPHAFPTAIAAGPDGALWFSGSNGMSNGPCSLNGSFIGRITTAGVVAEYQDESSAGTYWCPSSGITAGPDGSLWFTNNGNFQINNNINQVYLYATIGQAAFVTANLSVTPGTGYFGSQLTFSGSGFAPNETVIVYSGAIGSSTLTTATADSSGSFTARGAAQESALGPHVFLGVGQTSGKLGAANLSMSPLLFLYPSDGQPGSTVTVTGYGFGAWEPVAVYWGNPQALLGAVGADQYGTVYGFVFSVPSAAPTGGCSSHPSRGVEPGFCLTQISGGVSEFNI